MPAKNMAQMRCRKKLSKKCKKKSRPFLIVLNSALKQPVKPAKNDRKKDAACTCGILDSIQPCLKK